MSDLEQQLRDELEAVSSRHGSPDVDVVGLARVGRSERRRRTGIRVAAAAAVAVVVATTATTLSLGGSDGRGEDRPRSVPLSQLPVGAASTAPWFDGTTLHAGGTTYDYDERADSSEELTTGYAAGTTVVTLRRDGRWRGVAMRDGRSRELVSSSGRRPTFSLGVSPDGRTVAVSDRVSETEAEVTTYDVGRDDPLGRHRFTGLEAPQPFLLLDVDDDGRVLVGTDRYVGADEYFAWSAGTRPVEVAEPGDVGLGASSWNPSGTLRSYVTSDGEQGRWAVVEGPDRPAVDLPIPVSVDTIFVWGWEDDEHVVIEGMSSASPITQLRCDAVELTCERVPLED